MHRFVCRAAMLTLGSLFATASAHAQTSTAATVTFEVRAISEMSLSGSPATLIVNAAEAGAAPAVAVDQTTTWAITTNESNRKLTASVDPLPPGLTLSVSLVPPPGALSLGEVELTSTPQDVVTNISAVQASGLTVTYRLRASPAAGVIPPNASLVTFTITAGV